MTTNQIPSFTIKIGQQIEPSLVTIGLFDGQIPSLACGTKNGKVIIHSPHIKNVDDNESFLKHLNFNRKITALSSGSLESQTLDNNNNNNNNLLFVGGQSSLLAYDIDNNADVFFRDIQDGVNTLYLGKFNQSSNSLILAGGNCSVAGYDKAGDDIFWTVTGDNVSSLELFDINSDGTNELLIGSDDFEIRIFKNEEILYEITESDKIKFLKSLGGTKFAYGLANSTIGAYSSHKTRLWRVKTKNHVTALESFDLDNDGVPELVSGWNNGVFNVRNSENGEIIYKDSLGSSIAAIVKADYRLDGKENLMVCTESGDIKGYLPIDTEFVAMTESGAELAADDDDKALSDLQTKKIELTTELRRLEKTLKSKGEAAPGGLPPGTSLNYSLEASTEEDCVLLKVEATTDVFINTIVAVDFESIILEGSEIIAFSPNSLGKTAVLPLNPIKNKACKLHIQTHISLRQSLNLLNVFEVDVQIPTFSSFKKVDDIRYSPKPLSKVSFKLQESISTFQQWLSSNFLLPTPPKVNATSLHAYFVFCGQKMPFYNDSNKNRSLHITAIKSDGDENTLNVNIRCDSMDLAGDIFQDIINYFKLNESEAQIDFPDEFTEFANVTKRIIECNTARSKLTADMADETQRIKALVISAEDSRLIHDMQSMKRSYTELFSMNNQLISGYNLRASNHENLLSGLKEVNKMIQRVSNLRVGKAKTTMINECRQAVKQNNMTALMKIIKGR